MIRFSLIVAVIFCLNITAMGQLELPKTIKVPWSSKEENLWAIHTWGQPGTDRVLRLAFSTPFEDDSHGGVRSYMSWYQISLDGGKTYDKIRQVIQDGPEYSALHPIEPIWSGKNMYVASVPPPMLASNGQVMVPIYLWPLDKEGRRIHDKDILSYTACAVLIGTWNKDKTDLSWDCSDIVMLDSQTQSTRGAGEPTIIELDQPGHFLMVMRGSNAQKLSLPSYKWKSVSTDFCKTWSAPTPFTYSDGENFFSPSACSVFMKSSKTGKSYWFGNICPQNAEGNYPRFPLVIAELDPKTLGLIQSSVRVIDTRKESRGDTDKVQFSNFQVNEDPATGDFIVTLRLLDYPITETYQGRSWPHMRYVVPPEPAEMK